jgi:transposase
LRKYCREGAEKADVGGMSIATADTRRRALAAYERSGKPQPEIAALFGVTVRTFQRWWRAWRTEGRDAPGHSPGRPAVFVGATAERLRREVARQPDATLKELAARLGHIASYVTVHRALERLELRYKKRRSAPRSKIDRT